MADPGAQQDGIATIVGHRVTNAGSWLANGAMVYLVVDSTKPDEPLRICRSMNLACKAIASLAREDDERGISRGLRITTGEWVDGNQEN